MPRISRRRFAHEERRLREPRLDRGVEKLHQRRDTFEDLEQFLIEARARGQRCLVLARAEKLFELQVVRRRMVLRVAERHTRQAIASRRPLA